MYILTDKDYIINVDIDIDDSKIYGIISIIPDDKTIYKMFKNLLIEIINTRSITSINKLTLYKNSKNNNRNVENKDEKAIIMNEGYLVKNYIDDVLDAIKIIERKDSIKINVIELLKTTFGREKTYNKKLLHDKKNLYFDAINNTNILMSLNINNFSYNNKNKIYKKEVL